VGIYVLYSLRDENMALNVTQNYLRRNSEESAKICEID
jgi:hypothetical protein